MNELLTRAETFLCSNARLLERLLYAYRFRAGSREAVLAALRAYQNADGGFGNALEPDIRCPDSQPVPTQHALEILDDVGFEPGMVRMFDLFAPRGKGERGLATVRPSESAAPMGLSACARAPVRPSRAARAGCSHLRGSRPARRARSIGSRARRRRRRARAAPR